MGGSFNTREFFHGRSMAALRQVKWVFLLGAFVLPLDPSGGWPGVGIAWPAGSGVRGAVRRIAGRTLVLPGAGEPPAEPLLPGGVLTSLRRAALAGLQPVCSSWRAGTGGGRSCLGRGVLVGVAAGALRRVLPDGHRRRPGGHRRRHAVRAHRRQLLPVPPRLRSRRRPAGGSGERPGRRSDAAARRPGEPAPGPAAGGAGVGRLDRRRDARPGHAGQRRADLVGRRRAGYRRADAGLEEVGVPAASSVPIRSRGRSRCTACSSTARRAAP